MSTSSTKGTALITGASSGIGATYAKRLARRGYDLLLVARDEQRLQALAETLSTEHGVQVDTLRADLTRSADVQQVEQRLRDDARISVLINNAGIALNGTLADATSEQIESLTALNIVALTRRTISSGLRSAMPSQSTSTCAYSSSTDWRLPARQ